MDAAQSFGAISGDGWVLWGTQPPPAFSSKPLDVMVMGAVFTNSDEDAEIINSIRLHGKGSQNTTMSVLG